MDADHAAFIRALRADYIGEVVGEVDYRAQGLVALQRSVREKARELAAAEPLRSLVGEELLHDLSLEEAIRRTHVHYCHPVGTCALGPAGDELAVCDAAGRLHGIDRVVVADCSLMPVVPRANTNVPAVVVGERIADELLASL